MESVGSAGSGGRPVLDNIAELRESAEQLLDSPPRTPPRSPAPRRLVKPPVNSHLHRSASIAPGMKAKKYARVAKHVLKIKNLRPIKGSPAEIFETRINYTRIIIDKAN